MEKWLATFGLPFPNTYTILTPYLNSNQTTMNILFCQPGFPSKRRLFHKGITLALVFIFFLYQICPVFPTRLYAQTILEALPAPGTKVLPSKVFVPSMIKGIKLIPEDPLRFDFIIDNGDSPLEDDEAKEESLKLIKFFLAALTVPEKDLWVNLSPYENNRIIPSNFSQTAMGENLLAQDYLLKQLTASLTYPENKLGKDFWQRVYAKAQKLYNTTEIPVNTFNKVWIVPNKAVVYENGDSAFIAEAHLKVMLEEDYLGLTNNLNNKDQATDQLKPADVKTISNVSSDIVKEILIPEIEKEVNEGENFAPLRQAYYSMILATWFKRNLKESIFGKIYIEQGKTEGIKTADLNTREKIYQQYLEAFKSGVYNYIKEDYDPYSEQNVSRKYYSGGMNFVNTIDPIFTVTKDAAMVTPHGSTSEISVRLAPHSFVNRYIKEHLPKDLVSDVQNIDKYPGGIIPIEGLLKSAGQFAHIGLGTIYKKPVIYIDVQYQNNKDILAHEQYEIGKWESLRLSLGREPDEMRPWILDHFQQANTLAAKWHQEAPSIDHLYQESGVDSKKIIEDILQFYPEENDVNLAAGSSLLSTLRKKLTALADPQRKTNKTFLDRSRNIKPSWSRQPADPKTVRKSSRTFEYQDASQNFSGVDLEHFVTAQRRLANRNLPPGNLSKLLQYLELDQNSAPDAAYPHIYAALAKGQYSKDVIDIINTLPSGESTYADPRLDVTIVGQNQNPRSQGVNEAVANGIDAIFESLGLENFKIGQFGMGGKQNIDWLDNSGIDRIDVITRSAETSSGIWLHLTILKDTYGQPYIQIRNIEDKEEFGELMGYSPVFDKGTVLRIQVKENIPLAGKDLSITQEQMEDNLHKRFAFISGINITTKSGSHKLKLVNHATTKKLIIGKSIEIPKDKQGNMNVLFTDNSITFTDDGIGMAAQRLSKMFVPREREDIVTSLSKEERETELQDKVKVVHDTTLPHRISFARNGEVITAIDIPEDIQGSATAEGGLMLEFGRLMDVPESRDQIRIPTNLKPGEISNFEYALNHMINEIIRKPQSSLTDEEKVKYINTMIVGLDQISQGNAGYEHVINAIRLKTQNLLAPILQNLQKNNFVLLPHDKQFERIAIPEGKKVLYLHEQLFAWHGALSLKDVGGKIIQGITVGSDKRIPFVVVAFKDEHLKGIAKFKRLWYTLAERKKLPVIKTNRFIAIPSQLGTRLWELDEKRIYSKLDEKETKEFYRLAELVNILTGTEVATSYELTQTKPEMRIQTVEEIQASANPVDKKAVEGFNRFLKAPAMGTTQSQINIPADANQRLQLLDNGDVIDIETGHTIISNVKKLLPLGNDYYFYNSITPGIPTALENNLVIKIQNGVIDSPKTSNVPLIDSQPIISPDRRYVLIQEGMEYKFLDTTTGDKDWLFTEEVPYILKYPQFSADSQYFLYTLSDDANKDSVFSIMSLKNPSTSVWFKDNTSGGFSYAINEKNNHLIVSKNSSGAIHEFFVVDIATGKALWKPKGKHIFTDSTGAYTAVVDENDELQVFFHETHKVISKSDFGNQTIYDMHTHFPQGQPPAYRLTLVEPNGGSRSVFLTKDGTRTSDEVHPTGSTPTKDPRYNSTHEAFNKNGTTRLYALDGDVGVKILDQYPTGWIPPEPQRILNKTWIFKHPDFNLLIDNRDPGAPKAIDIETGKIFPLRPNSEVVSYRMGMAGTHCFIVTRNKNTEFYQQIIFDIRGPSPVIAESSKAAFDQKSGIHILSSMGTFEAYDGQKNIPSIAFNQYSPADYNVVFDGKHFVFTHKTDRSAPVAYFDPKDLDHPVVITPGLQKAKPSTDVILDTKPSDAPNNEELVAFKLTSTTTQIRTIGKGTFDNLYVDGGDISFEKVNPQVSIEYIDSKAVRLFVRSNKKKIDSFNLVVNLTAPIWQSSLLAHNDKFAIVRDGLFTKIIDYRDPNNTHPSSFPFNVTRSAISASGRYSVHWTHDNKISIIDHESPGVAGVVITTLDIHPDESFYLAPTSDTLISEIVSGTEKEYAVLRLGKDDMRSMSDASHIETDSTGTFSIIVDRGSSTFPIMSLTLLDQNLLVPPSSSEFKTIRISSDDQYLYAIGEKNNNFELRVYDKTNRTQPNQIYSLGTWNGRDHPGVQLPRFWELFDENKKTIWDREAAQNGRDPDVTPVLPIGSNVSLTVAQYHSPLGPHRQLKLDGNLLYDIYVDGTLDRKGALRVFDLQSGQAVSTGPGADYSLKNTDKMIDSLIGKDVFIFKYTTTLKASFLSTGESFLAFQMYINDDKTFLISEDSPQPILVDKNGKNYGLNSIIPPGYVVSGTNGKYFVLFNSTDNKIKYLDPDAIASFAPSLEQIVDPIVLKRWTEDVASRGNLWVAQAQSAYNPLLEMIEKEYPEYFPEVQRSLISAVNNLYSQQQNTIDERFQKTVKDKTSFDTTPSFPFDQFLRRLTELQNQLTQHLEDLKTDPYIAQEEFEFKKDYYIKLFVNLVKLSANPQVSMDAATATETISREEFTAFLFEAIGHGWTVDTQEGLNMVPLIGKLIKDIKSVTKNEVKMKDISKIVEFLSGAMSRSPSLSAPVITKQLQKIILASPQTRKQFLKRWLIGFQDVSLKDLLDFVRLPAASSKIGDARPFAVFLTNDVEQVREETKAQKEAFLPQGENIALPSNGVDLSSIIEEEEIRPKKEGDSDFMSVDYFIEHLNRLPPESDKLKTDLLRDVLVQRESGAYTAEIAQNSRDAKAAELDIDYYLHQNEETGLKEFIEEAGDNGTGALQEMALLLYRKSTKVEGEQKESIGYFGTGKFTIFEGVDRVEIITKNSNRAYMFVVKIEKDADGNPTGIRLVQLRKVIDPDLKTGVTIRRVKSVDNTIPELDQMLSQRSWKIFAGLSQTDTFKISNVHTDGKKRERQPLTVDHEVLSESDFKATSPKGSQETNFGKIKVIATKDMPLQILDKAGLRVGEIKKEYLALIPPSFQRHIYELGLNIQIPLPLIRGRSGFEHEQDYLPAIQKAVAIEFFKALVYKVLTQKTYAFVFEGLPEDYDSNFNINDKSIIEVSNLINEGEYGKISIESLRGMMQQFSEEKDMGSQLFKLLVLLKISTQEGTMSLFSNRWKVQNEKRNRQRSENELNLLRSLGYKVDMNEMFVRQDSLFYSMVGQAEGIELAHEQMRHTEDFLVNPKTYTDQDQYLIAMGFETGKPVGIEQVLLVENVGFAGAFRTYDGKRTMFLNRTVGYDFGKPNSRLGIFDEGINTIVHELAHFLENKRDQDIIWKSGFVSHASNYTHHRIGPFADAMKYMATLALSNENLLSLPADAASATKPDEKLQTAETLSIDSALPTDKATKENLGGIDFDPNKLTIESRGKKVEWTPAFNAQNLDKMPIDGFTPIIIQITPVANFQLLLSAVKDNAEQNPLSLVTQ